MTLEELLVFGVGLLSIVNPFANIGAFAAVTGSYPRLIQKQIALRTTLAVTIVMVGAAWVGLKVLKLLGITVPMLQTAGGLILLINALKMVTGSLARSEEGSAGWRDDWRAVAVVPLGIPLTVGGATVALIIATASAAGGLVDLMKISGVCLLVALISGMLYVFAQKLSRHLGPTGLEIITRLSGIILASIAIGVFAAGLRGLFPGLAGS